MTRLTAEAEVRKLERELGADEGHLDFLADAATADLRRLRHGLAHALDAGHRPMFRRLAAASKLLPAPLVGRIATSLFGPMLSGRVATELSPARAARMLEHVPVDFVAASCPYLDPEAAGPIVRGLPLEVMLPSMRLLLQQGDHVTLGRFVGIVTEAQLIEIAHGIERGEDLLLVGLYTEDETRLEVVFDALADDRVVDILEAARDRGQLADSLLLLRPLSEGARARITGLVLARPDLAEELLADVRRHDAWEDLAVALSGRTAADLEELGLAARERRLILQAAGAAER